jgi:hypothetical protein
VNSWMQAIELSSSTDHFPVLDENNSSSQNTQQSDRSKSDPLTFECNDIPTIFSDDDPDIL